jgi:predicted MFS family arabinose efflux permease
MGLSAILQAISSSFTATSVGRFISGMSQGTFSSTVPLYYTYWYTREEMALRVTLYIGVGASLGFLLLDIWSNCRRLLYVRRIRCEFD